MWGYGNLGGRSTLRVYASASVGALPATARNGDIGIITSDAITSFFVDNDALASPAEGMVQIETTISNGAPVQLIPTVKIYPLRATQYLSSVWVYKDMRVRYGDAWVMPAAYLYYQGTHYTAFTGGMQARAWAQTSAFTSPTAPTITLGASSFTMELSGALKSGVYEILSDINLTNYTTLRLFAKTTANNANTYARLGVSTRSNTYWETGATGVTNITSGETWTAYNLDVSAMNGSYDVYVGISVGGAGSAVSLEASYLMLIP